MARRKKSTKVVRLTRAFKEQVAQLESDLEDLENYIRSSKIGPGPYYYGPTQAEACKLISKLVKTHNKVYNAVFPEDNE